MLDTIPLKKKSPKKSLSGGRNINHLSVGGDKSKGLRSKGKLKPWVLAILVLGIVVTGIVVYRSSQASTSGLGAIPQNITDIQNYIDSLSLQNPNAKSATVNNYAEFTYTPKTTEEVKTVGYYIDGKMYATSNKPPYNIAIDTTRIANGEHEITAVGFNNQDVPVAAVQKNILVENNSNILRSVNNIITYPWNWLFRL